MSYGIKRFVHLGINPRALVFAIAVNSNVEAFLNKNAADWYRYGTQNYVVWTDIALADLADAIRKLPNMANSYVFASEMSEERDGMMPKEFWEWLNKLRMPY